MIDVQQQIKRGFFWFGSASVLMRLIDLGSTLVILALLSRAQMGLAALSWSGVVVIEAFNGLGGGTALVQAESVSSDEKNSLFWFSLGVGLLMAGVMLLIAPFLASYYGEPVLLFMVMVSGLKLILVGSALIPLQLLTRALRFKEIGGLQAAATFGEAVTKVSLALFGLGAWSLVIANVSRGLFLILGLLLISRFRPRLHFRFVEVQRFLSFGIRAASSRIIFHFYRNLDALVVGRVLGMEALGIYRVAVEVAMSPTEAVLHVIRRVAYPVFSRVGQDKEALKGAFLRMSRYLIFLTGPIALFLFFGAEQLIGTITHERWLPAAPLVQLLCWGGLMRGLAQLFPELFLAGGRPILALWDSLFSLLLLFLAFGGAAYLFADTLGLMAIAYAWVFAYPLLLLLLRLFARLTIPLDFWGYLQNLLPASLGLLLTGGALFLLDHLLLPKISSSELQLALLAVLTLGSSLFYLHFVLKLSLREVLPKG